MPLNNINNKQTVKTEPQKQVDLQQKQVAENNSKGYVKTPPPRQPGIVNNAAIRADSYRSDIPEAPAPQDTVNPDTDTVEGRLDKLTSTDSKYMQTARSNAMRTANDRGLVNSSIAAGAGEKAAIESALPIAQQDAQIYADRSKNQQSADLNKEIAAFENNLAMDREEYGTEVKLRAERILNDDKFDNETKIQYLTSIDSIIRDTNANVNEISLSDRSAEQQAAAIKTAQDNRDAQIAVYEDLLEQMPNWSWGTDFTQKRVESTPVAIKKDPEPAGRSGVGD